MREQRKGIGPKPPSRKRLGATRLNTRCSCGDGPTSYIPGMGCYCKECEAEILMGVVPPLEEITSTLFHVPYGVSITSHQRQPGTGDGNDYFGNHT